MRNSDSHGNARIPWYAHMTGEPSLHCNIHNFPERRCTARYNIPSFLSIPEKTALATQILLPPPNDPPFPTLAITFFSASSFPLAFPPTVALGFGWPKLGFGVEGVNGRVGTWLIDMLSSSSAGKLQSSSERAGKDKARDVRLRGWALLDFFEHPENNAVVPLLVECNFRGREKGEEGWPLS